MDRRLRKSGKREEGRKRASDEHHNHGRKRSTVTCGLTNRVLAGGLQGLLPWERNKLRRVALREATHEPCLGAISDEDNYQARNRLASPTDKSLLSNLGGILELSIRERATPRKETVKRKGQGCGRSTRCETGSAPTWG